MRIVFAAAMLILVSILGWLLLPALFYPTSGKRYRALTETLKLVVCEQLSEAARRRADDQSTANDPTTAGAPSAGTSLATCHPIKQTHDISIFLTSRAYSFEIMGLSCAQIRSFVQPRLDLIASAHVKLPVEFHVQPAGPPEGSRPEPFRLHRIDSGTIDRMTDRGRLRPILTGCSPAPGGSSVVYELAERSTSSLAALRASIESLVLEQLAGVAINVPVAPNCKTLDQAMGLILHVRNQFSTKPTLPLEAHFEPCRLVRPAKETWTYVEPRRLHFQVLGATCEQLRSQVQPRLKTISDGFEHLPLAMGERYGAYYKLLANRELPKRALPGIYTVGTIGPYERRWFTAGEIYRPTLESCSEGKEGNLATYYLSDR